jgi:hypothetical protein
VPVLLNDSVRLHVLPYFTKCCHMCCHVLPHVLPYFATCCHMFCVLYRPCLILKPFPSALLPALPPPPRPRARNRPVPSLTRPVSPAPLLLLGR